MASKPSPTQSPSRVARERLEEEIGALEQSVRGLRAERMALQDREREIERQERTLVAHISGLRAALKALDEGAGAEGEG